MPAGDRQRTWFPEMVETLRAGWRAQMSWEDLIALCNRLDSMLQHIRHSRNITPATTSMLCPCCGGPMIQGAGSVSVHATILALGRFGIQFNPAQDPIQAAVSHILVSDRRSDILVPASLKAPR